MLRMAGKMWYDALIVFVGYGFSILVGHWLIRTLVMRLWSGLGWKQNVDAEYLFRLPVLPEMVGILERMLYTTAMLIGQPGFIGFWLALKVAGGWKGWSEPVRTPDGKVIMNGRDLFSVFLIGSGFSIAYAVTGALLMEWWKNGQLVAAVGVPVLLVLGTLGYIAWGRQLAR
jgi:hypothetical protein